MNKPSWSQTLRKFVSGRRSEAVSEEEDRLMEALEPRLLYSAAPVSEVPDSPEGESLTEDTGSTATSSATTNALAAPDLDLIDNLLSEDDLLSDSEVETLVRDLAQTASQIWTASGLSESQESALAGVSYRIEDLGGRYLGATEGNVIILDDDAAGRGWFVDGSQPVDASRVDLLTILLHEQGHVLGLLDAEEGSGIMMGLFEIGERRGVEQGEAAGAEAGALSGTHYATLTWDGAPDGGGASADANWGTSDNWTGDVAPDDSGDWDTFVFGASTQLNPNVNFAGDGSGHNVNDLTFTAGAGAYTITGNKTGGGSIALDMLGTTSGSAASATAEVTNLSSATQTLDLNLRHREQNIGLIFNAAVGDLVVSGNISNLNSTSLAPVSAVGPGTTTFSGTNSYIDTTEVGALELTDDLESSTIGTTTAFDWSTNGSAKSRIVDDGSGTNKILEFGWKDGFRGSFRSLDAGIGDNESGVVSFRAQSALEGTHYYGVTNVDVPPTASSPAASTLPVMIGLEGGGSSVSLVTEPGGTAIVSNLSVGTWYDIQLHVDNSTDSYDVYLDGVRVATSVAFRAPVAEALDRFVVAGADLSANDNEFTGRMDDLAVTRGGTLILNGSHTGAGGYTVHAGATLRGIGSTDAAVTANGTLSPGDPAAASGVGSLAVGSVTFGAGAVFDVQIHRDGASTAGVSNDVVQVSGNVVLGSGVATLNVTSLGTVPVGAHTYTLISNTGGSTSGHFRDGVGNALMEGATVTLGAVDYTLSYVGGTGNDVTLTGNSGGATKDVGVTGEDTLLSVPADGVLSNDTNPDTGAASGTLVVTTADGRSAFGASVTVNADGSYTYDPRTAALLQMLGEGETVVDTFNYTMQDTTGPSSTSEGTVSITVTGKGAIEIDTAHTLPDGSTLGTASVADTITVGLNGSSDLVINVNGSDVKTIANSVLTGASPKFSLEVSGETDQDTVNLADLGADLLQDVTVTAQTVNLNADLDVQGDQTYNGAITLAADRTLGGANVTFNGATSLNDLTLILDLSGTATNSATGSFDFAAGTLTLSNGTAFANAGTALFEGQASGAHDSLNGSGTFTNNATFNHSSTISTDNFILGDSVSFVNAAGGTFFFNSGGDLEVHDSASFDNQGTMQKTAAAVGGSNDPTFIFSRGGEFSNSGTLQVDAGELSVAGGLTSSGFVSTGGSFVTTGSGRLTFTGKWTELTGVSTIGGGDVEFDTDNPAGTSGGTFLAGATTTVLNVTGDGLRWEAGDVDLNGNTVRNDGILRVDGTGADLVDGIGGGSFDNAGTLNLNSGVLSLDGVDLGSSGTINLTGSTSLDGTNSLVSTGTFNLNAGTLTVNNGGGVSSSGTTNLNANVGLAGSGSFTNASGGILELSAGGGNRTLTLNGTLTNQGTVRYTADGNITLVGSGSFINNATFDHLHGGANDNFIVSGSVTFNNASGGTLHFQNRGDLNIVSNGVFNNSGLIRKSVAGSDATYIFGSGTFNNLAGGEVRSNAGQIHIGLTGTQNSEAAAAFTADGGDVGLGGAWTGTLSGTSGNSGKVEITASGNGAIESDFKAGADGVILNVTGDGLFWDRQTIDTQGNSLTNTGTFVVTSGGAKTVTGSSYFTNTTGTITFQSGAVALTGAGIQNLATMNFTTASTSALSGTGKLLNGAGGTVHVTGSGTLVLDGTSTTIDNDGTFNWSNSAEINFGTAGAAFQNDGTFNWNGTGPLNLSAAGATFDNNGSFNWNSTGRLDLIGDGATVQNDGIFTWGSGSSAGTLDIEHANATFQNNGTVNATGGANRAFAGIGSFINDGTFLHASTSTSADNLQGLNSGGSFVNNGIFEFTARGDFEMRDGYTFTNSSSGTMRKTGDNNSDPAQFFSFSAQAGAGTVSIAGTLEVNVGSVRATTSASGGNFDDVSVSQISGTTLSGGTWIASPTGGNNAIIDLEPAEPGGIDTIGASASVTLTGANASFVQLTNNLAQIDGSLRVNGTQNFSLAGGGATVGSGGSVGGNGTLSGDLTLISGSTLNLGIGSSGTEDPLLVTGNVNLGGSTLNLEVDASATISNGSVLTILTSGSLTGQFAGLGEGATVTSNGHSFTISYAGNEVQLTALEDAPVANNDTNSLTEGGAGVSVADLTGNVLSNDSDPEQGALAVTDAGVGGTADTSLGGGSIVLGGTYGNLQISADGSYVYDEGATGAQATAINNLTSSDLVSDTFTYRLEDGDSATATATLTINITGVNDPPAVQFDDDDARVFGSGGKVTVEEDSAPDADVGGVGVPGHLITGAASGAYVTADAVETSQSIAGGFSLVSNSNATLFAQAPAIDGSGHLSFVLASGQKGTALVTFQVTDDGSGASPSDNTREFTVEIEVTTATAGFSLGSGEPVAQNEDFAAATFGQLVTRVGSGSTGIRITNTLVDHSYALELAGSPVSKGDKDFPATGTVISLTDVGNLIVRPGSDFTGTVRFSYVFVNPDGTESSEVQAAIRSNREAPLNGEAEVTSTSDAGEVTVGGFVRDIRSGSGGGPISFSTRVLTYPEIFSRAPEIQLQGNQGDLSFQLAGGVSGRSLVEVDMFNGREHVRQTFFVNVLGHSTSGGVAPAAESGLVGHDDYYRGLQERGSRPVLALGYPGETMDSASDLGGYSILGKGPGTYPSPDLMLTFTDAGQFLRSLEALSSLTGSYREILVFDAGDWSEEDLLLLPEGVDGQVKD